MIAIGDKYRRKGEKDNDYIVTIYKIDYCTETGKEYISAKNKYFSFSEINPKGCMVQTDKKDFLNRYEKVNKVTLPWSDWTRDILVFSYEDIIYHYDCFYRTNGKKVIVKTKDGVKSYATCHKDDVFNLKKGLGIAKKRIVPKLIKNIVKEQIRKEC